VAESVAQEDGYEPIIQAVRHAIGFHGWLRTRDPARSATEALYTSLVHADTPEGERRALRLALADATTTLCRAAWATRLYDNADDVRDALRDYQDAKKNVGGRGIDFVQSLERFEFAQEDLARYFPVWITTALSVRNALPLRPALFDLVVIDEASQCDLASAVPLLFRARRAAVISDPHQLRHIASISTDHEERIPTPKGIVPRWSYVRHSLFDGAARAILEADGSTPLFLEEHYRSHPDIIQFSNRQYYGGQLVVRTDLARLTRLVSEDGLGVFWHDVRGKVPPSARSAYNDLELAAVLEHLEYLLKTTGSDTSVGVVTPFRAQSDRLKNRIRAAAWYDTFKKRIGAGTAHTFQGDERDVKIFSPVVAEGMRPGTVNWAATTEALLNVAITRARAGLHFVGDVDACRAAGGSLGALARYVARGAV